MSRNTKAKEAQGRGTGRPESIIHNVANLRGARSDGGFYWRSRLAPRFRSPYSFFVHVEHVRDPRLTASVTVHVRGGLAIARKVAHPVAIPALIRTNSRSFGGRRGGPRG